MEESKTQIARKAKSKKLNYGSIRVKNPTRKLLDDILKKANKKQFGRRIKADAIVSLALTMITDSHIEELQQKSLSNADRMEVLYRDYVRKNGSVSKDEFLGTLLNGNCDILPEQSETNSSDVLSA